MIRIDDTRHSPDSAHSPLPSKLQQLLSPALPQREPVTEQVPTRFGLIVIPVMPDKRIVLRLRFCEPEARWSLELPRIDAQRHENGWRHAARKCLAETAGMRAKRWSLLGTICFDFGVFARSMFVVSAQNCRRLPSKALPNDAISALAFGFSVRAVRQMICDRDIYCGITLSGLAMLRLHKKS